MLRGFECETAETNSLTAQTARRTPRRLARARVWAIARHLRWCRRMPMAVSQQGPSACAAVAWTAKGRLPESIDHIGSRPWQRDVRLALLRFLVAGQLQSQDDLRRGTFSIPLRRLRGAGERATVMLENCSMTAKRSGGSFGRSQRQRRSLPMTTAFSFTFRERLGRSATWTASTTQCRASLTKVSVFVPTDQS